MAKLRALLDRSYAGVPRALGHFCAVVVDVPTDELAQHRRPVRLALSTNRGGARRRKPFGWNPWFGDASE